MTENRNDMAPQGELSLTQAFYLHQRDDIRAHKYVPQNVSYSVLTPSVGKQQSRLSFI